MEPNILVNYALNWTWGSTQTYSLTITQCPASVSLKPSETCLPVISVWYCLLLGLVSYIKTVTKVHMVKAMVLSSCGFTSSHVWIWELDHKEGWAPENWCFWTVVLEKTLESPLDCKELKPVNLKGNTPWIFIGRTDAEAEAPILWPPDAKSQLTGKDPDAGKDWGQEEKGQQRMVEDEMVDWHHWLSVYESEKTPGDGEGQGSLTCYSL